MVFINFFYNEWNYCSPIHVVGNKKAVVVRIPFILRRSFRKKHVRLVHELEKKFSGKVWLFIYHFMYNFVLSFGVLFFFFISLWIYRM